MLQFKFYHPDIFGCHTRGVYSTNDTTSRMGTARVEQEEDAVTRIIATFHSMANVLLVIVVKVY